MQIFQIIWTALTTENELLTKIIFIPEIFIETTIDMLLFTTLLDISSNKNIKLRYVLLVSILGNISNIFIPNPYKSFINLFVIFMSIILLFKTNILKSLFATILPLFITVLCESLFMKVCISYFSFDTTSIIAIPLYKLSISLFIQLLVFLTYKAIKYLKLQVSIVEDMSNKSKTILLINFLFAILAIVVQFFITGFYLNKLPIYIVILSNITLIVYFLLNIYSLIKTSQLEIANLNLEQEKEHNRILKAAQDDIRGFRHDFSNIICTIGGYVHSKDMDGLENYFEQIQTDVVKVNNLTALTPDIINNPAIYALVTAKYDKASNLNIKMSVEVFMDLNIINMKIYEFTRILGILLDNAIEAADECDERNIYVHIRNDQRHNRQLLIIENTYKDKNIDTDKIYEKNYSTKPKNTGLGLWEVRQILKRNNNLNLYTTKTERLFKQQLEIYNT